MAIKLTQNTSIHWRKKRIQNYFLNVPCKKRWHFPIDINSIWFNVRKDNNFFELHNFLEHNDFASKLAKTFNHVMLIYIMNKI
jgi:hypothetical protein